MNRFVITYVYLKQDNEVIWHGDTAAGAVNTFLLSFDEVDRQKVENIKVYDLVEAFV